MEGWFHGRVVEGQWNKSLQRYLYRVEFQEREEQDVVTEDELADIIFSKEPFRDPTLYTFDEFVVLWERLQPEEIEKSQAIRRANTRVATEDSGSQHNAQYGRFLPEATEVSQSLYRSSHGGDSIGT